ncbi:MAG: arcadin 1 [Candidatus Bathyarchaeota archaeon]|nr:arcadin 1 [Candidatus Bathyarchaeota archaeon]
MSASLSSRIRLKVQSVKAVKDMDGREGYQIDFVEVRQRPPMVMMTPTEVPKEISQMVVQISKSVQRAMPGGESKEYELRKLTVILTADELEAFRLKPYPNQMYELTITDGALYFKEI